MAIDTKLNLSCCKFEQISGETLNLSGNTNFYGTLSIIPNKGSGKILTSDTNGNATWQSAAAGGTITGATNGLSVSGKNIGLGGTLTGNTCINYNNNCLCLTDTGGTNYALFANDCIKFNRNDGTNYNSNICVESSNIRLQSCGNLINFISDLNVAYNGSYFYSSDGVNNITSSLSLSNNCLDLASCDAGTGKSLQSYICVRNNHISIISFDGINNLQSNLRFENNCLCLSSKCSTCNNICTNICLTSQGAEISSYQKFLINTGFTGIVYAHDYSAAYTNRSLVDKEYVDNAIGTSGGTMNAVTGATNLGSGNGEIYTSVSDNKLQLKTLSGGTNVTITCDGNYIAINAADIGIVWSGITANGIGTYIDANKICSQPNLTFDGTKLNIIGNIYASTCIVSPVVSGSTCVTGIVTIGRTCVCSPVILGSTCICSPITCGSTCLAGGNVKGSIVSGSTCIYSPVTYGTTCVCSPIILGSTCSCSPIVFGSTCICSPISCGSTCVVGVITCGTTCVQTALLCSTGNVKGTIITGSTCITSPIICGGTCVCSPAIYGTKVYEGGTCLASTYLPFTMATDQKDPTGFVDGNNINVSYNWGARQITLTGTLDYYWNGVKKTFTSPKTFTTGHTATVGHWYLYSTDGTNVTWSQSVWAFDNLQVAHVYYKATSGATFGVRETHGLMPWTVHEDLHNTIGTYIKSGGQATANSWTAATASDSATSPSFNAATLNDEDLQSTIDAWLKTTGYTLMYVTGNTTSVYILASTRPFQAAGANQFMYYYPPSTGIATAGANNRWLNVYQILLPTTSDASSQKYRMIFLQPQILYTSLAAAQAEDTRGLYLGSLSSESAEYVIYTRITYALATGNNNYGRATIPTNGITYIVGSKMSSLSVAGISSTNHANLSNLTWANSGHLGTNSTFAAFDSNGDACNVTLWSGTTANGVGTYVNAECICSNSNMTFDGTQLKITGNVCATTCVRSALISGATTCGGIVCGGTCVAGGYVKGTTISGTTCVTSPITCGDTCVISPITIGTTCVCSPIVLGSTCVCSPINIGSTCSCSPIVLGSTCVCSPIVLGSTCACSPIVLGSTCIVGGAIQGTTISGTTCVTSPITIGTTCVCSPIVLASTCACSPITCGSTCVISPITIGSTCACSPIVLGSTCVCGAIVCSNTTAVIGTTATIGTNIILTTGAARCVYFATCSTGIGSALCIIGNTGLACGGVTTALAGGTTTVLGGTGGAGTAGATGGAGGTTTVLGGTGGAGTVAGAGGTVYICGGAAGTGTSPVVGLVCIVGSTICTVGTTCLVGATCITGALTTSSTICSTANICSNTTIFAKTCVCATLCVLAGTCGSAPDWVATSDKRLKTNIQPLSNSLSIIQQLCGICYSLCSDNKNQNQIGLIAQDVELVLPEIVSHGTPDEDDKKYGIMDDKLGLKYDKISAVLIEAIKEQQAQINELKIEINKLKQDKNI
jgi:hypothetical protein